VTIHIGGLTAHMPCMIGKGGTNKSLCKQSSIWRALPKQS